MGVPSKRHFFDEEELAIVIIEKKKAKKAEENKKAVTEEGGHSKLCVLCVCLCVLFSHCCPCRRKESREEGIERDLPIFPCINFGQKFPSPFSKPHHHDPSSWSPCFLSIMNMEKAMYRRRTCMYICLDWPMLLKAIPASIQTPRRTNDKCRGLTLLTLPRSVSSF
mgnify:CR=1 FL=1